MENLFIFLLIVCTFFVLFVNSPIKSLLFLIMSFALSSILFLYLGIEFLSLLIFIVYIGAIAVLFLFVVMMLNIKIVELKSSYLNYLSIGFLIILFFILQLGFYVCNQFYYSMEFLMINFDYIDWVDLLDFKGNIFLLGSIIYSLYSNIFVLLTLILFIALIGSVTLIYNSNFIINKFDLVYVNSRYFLMKPVNKVIKRIFYKNI